MHKYQQIKHIFYANISKINLMYQIFFWDIFYYLSSIDLKTTLLTLVLD